MKRAVARLTSDSSKYSLIANHEFVGLAILFALLFSVATMHAQSSDSSEFDTIMSSIATKHSPSPWSSEFETMTMNELTPAAQPGQAQDLLLDHAVKSFLGNMAATLANVAPKPLHDLSLRSQRLGWLSFGDNFRAAGPLRG